MSKCENVRHNYFYIIQFLDAVHNAVFKNTKKLNTTLQKKALSPPSWHKKRGGTSLCWTSQANLWALRIRQWEALPIGPNIVDVALLLMWEWSCCKIVF